uniref:AFG2 interacting ribosome maturation factor n=1 Tax=Fundulus heteroclitus TaxID=8078 RepID=A0A3Q2QR84_FUNHE
MSNGTCVKTRERVPAEGAQMSLQGALRRSFVALHSQRAVWRSVLEECDPLMESLGNLGEQMRALSRVRVSDTPLRVFPELQERLQVQLLQAADLLLQRLRSRMSHLQSVRDAISNQVSAVLQLYEDAADSLDLAAVTQRCSVIPSLADMLAWLQDAERFYKQQFLQRKTLLQTLRLDDLSQLESVFKRWKILESPDSEQEITDALCRLSFFMESHR